ncbi:MAG: hypothetical protein H7282_06555 [Cytophagaceae bacterium]|nr:hypothetical protein [Cytophagaceae bacterium]
MKKLLLATTLFAFFALAMSCEKSSDAPAPAPAYNDSLVITSVTPATGLTETSTTFTVNVKYRLESSSQGELNIGFNNSSNPATYDMIASASKIVASGSGTATFTVTITPKKWASPNKFYVYVNLANYPHPLQYSPAAGDIQELTFPAAI